MAEHVDEEHCLDALDGALPAEQRNDDVAADVGQHAPEQGMRQTVEALQSEQRIGQQQLDAEGTLLDERGRQPAQIGRAHVCTPVTNAHLVCRLLLEKKKKHTNSSTAI